MNLIILALIIFCIAILMTMTGRGGGNFYVLALVFSFFLLIASILMLRPVKKRDILVKKKL